MPFDRRTAEQHVYLVVVVPVSPQILNDAKGGLAVCDRGIEVVLLAVFVD